MRKVGKAILYFFAWAFLTGIIVSVFSSGDKQAPDSVVSFSAIASVVILVLLSKAIKKRKNNPTQYSSTRITPIEYNPNAQANSRQINNRSSITSTTTPKTKELVSLDKQSSMWLKSSKLPSAKKCRELADSYIAYSKQRIQWAFSSESIVMFFSWAEDVRESLKQAIRFEEKAGYSFTERPSTILNQFERDFQWKLRDAIEREKNHCIQEMIGPQRNNKRECVNQVAEEIKHYKEGFSEETLQYALEAYYSLCSFAGISYQPNSIFSTNSEERAGASKEAETEDYETRASQLIEKAYNTASIQRFFSKSEEVRKYLNESISNENNRDEECIEKLSQLLNDFEYDFQWKLRDTIEREEKYLISEIGGRQRNNKKECCNRFYQEIQSYKEFFSEDTIDFAMDAYYRVCEEAGLTPKTNGMLIEGKSSLAEVDVMDGHAFEAFCADLLCKNGFEKVEKTKGSGDQGVDILAEKDGIRFAIQCKCYSSDLGNKPIQEVFAGKSIYNCQVAVVMTNRYFTVGGLEASKATGVLLWDRRKLQEFIEYAYSFG